MAILLLLGILLFAVLTVFTVTQIIMPLLRNEALFPVVRDKPQLVKEAEDRLMEARAAKRAAETEKEVARLNNETRTLNKELNDKKQEKE